MPCPKPPQPGSSSYIANVQTQAKGADVCCCLGEQVGVRGAVVIRPRC